MIYQIQNELGVIILNKMLVEQIIDDAFEPLEGKIWLENHYDIVAPTKEISMGDNGVLVELFVVFRFGESIENCCRRLMKSIAEDIEFSLNLPLDNIVIHITATKSKNFARRNLLYDYNTIFGISHN